MSAQRQNAGDLSGDLFRAIEQARHLKTGTAFKNYFVDQQLFRGELSRDPRVQRSFFRKRTETFRQPFPDILPVGFGIGFGPDIVQTCSAFRSLQTELCQIVILNHIASTTDRVNHIIRFSGECQTRSQHESKSP